MGDHEVESAGAQAPGVLQGEFEPSQADRVTAGSWAILLAVFCAGAGTMVVELAAVRLLAPWFGASTGVWTNVIGVILLALAVGYVCGARMSTSGSPDKRLGFILLSASALTACLPLVAGSVAELFMPAGLALDEAAGLMLWGSLASSMALFAPVAALLGCGCPLAVEALQVGSGGHAGAAGGRVLGTSTLGSLLGTFGTTHWLLPGCGLLGTFQVAAVVLGLAGFLLLARTRTPRSSALGLLFLVLGVVGAFLPEVDGPAPGANWRTLEQRESAYQRLAVLENSAGNQRRLVANEALDSFQSVWQVQTGLLGGGQYYDYFALPAWWADPQDTWEVLTLGMGAGTAVRVLEGAMPPNVALISIGVEIDPAVVELGELYFGLQRNQPGRSVLAGVDARVALQGVARPQDLVIVDCYSNNMEIPPHLCSVEFFREAVGALAPGGFLMVNAAGFGFTDPVVDALGVTLAQAAGAEVLAFRVPFSRNCVLVARAGMPVPRPGALGWDISGPIGESLLRSLEVPSAWKMYSPEVRDPQDVGAPVLTDDLNPMDQLQRASVSAGRQRWTVGA
ncbi:MAG: fused MFS/spermidine synthase [Planctomycetota bacterium]|nr:fused MFS/spermidine synthase [Planctomycetota bacterium]